mmetsp:Transcript_16900/g.21383  ORF Transcript_16900/g.21383 Transcript_16900/m.21383 type:complete len:206 (+) Transcript_16900:2-619(+)
MKSKFYNYSTYIIMEGYMSGYLNPSPSLLFPFGTFTNVKVFCCQTKKWVIFRTHSYTRWFDIPYMNILPHCIEILRIRQHCTFYFCSRCSLHSWQQASPIHQSIYLPSHSTLLPAVLQFHQQLKSDDSPSKVSTDRLHSAHGFFVSLDPLGSSPLLNHTLPSSPRRVVEHQVNRPQGCLVLGQLGPALGTHSSLFLHYIQSIRLE